jgi:hypothetical protein
MSRRLGLRLIPERDVEEHADVPADADQLSNEVLERIARRAARDDRDQPPALADTPAATPSG